MEWLAKVLLRAAAALTLGTTVALAGSPSHCKYEGAWPASAGRAPSAVLAYLQAR